ncbi:MAG: transglycosylase SLT domain-containing protein [Bacteroidota bacterium]|nr:transglycosylase SLT domain-containing protein [Bacteroidota bacterium]MDP3144969.1 transglycosylase SLT domain-containing protein [Bacteroidota bacterium]MDP3556001.1 transglycosylase SLT domain-containing protein [Bacteroidota bacterium]
MGSLKKYFVLLSLSVSVFVNAQTIGQDDPIAAMLDSLLSQKMFETAFSKPIFPKNNKYKFAVDSIPKYDDYTYQSRLAKLDAVSPFDLVYNEHVKGFINMYAMRKRESVSRMMGVAQLYYPMFEEVFDRYNIPLELKHLAVIESALIPYAKSKAGATGLWQFMYPTGKMFGLNVTSYVDQRCDPYKATVAAAEYLKSLYGMFGDWQMVLAAYNAGPGTISKAIRRSGGKKTYWEIRPYLPTETQGYVPAFIAANYVMCYGAEHNIYAAVPRKTYFEVDTVVVKEQMNFEQLSQALDISQEEILYFNPQYRKNIIPAGGNTMCLPKNKIGIFLTNEQDIYAAIKAQQKEGLVVESLAEIKKTHKVKSGEKLSSIARKYGVTVADLKNWNYVGKNGIKPGKTLTVYVREQQNSKPKEIDVKSEKNVAVKKEKDVKTLAENNSSTKSEVVWHKVKKGESLYIIAKNFGVTAADVKSLNNLKSNNLNVGQLLKIKNK